MSHTPRCSLLHSSPSRSPRLLHQPPPASASALFISALLLERLATLRTARVTQCPDRRADDDAAKAQSAYDDARRELHTADRPYLATLDPPDRQPANLYS